MKKRYILIIVVLIFILFGCSNGEKIYVDQVESKIVINEEHEAITFYSLIKNDGGEDSRELYAKFVIDHEQLANALQTDEIIFSDDLGNPTPFQVEKKNGYFITLTYYYNEKIPLDELVDAVTVIVYDKDENEVARYKIGHVLTENGDAS